MTDLIINPNWGWLFGVAGGAAISRPGADGKSQCFASWAADDFRNDWLAPLVVKTNRTTHEFKKKSAKPYQNIISCAFSV
jgi:hypothetical protein